MGEKLRLFTHDFFKVFKLSCSDFLRNKGDKLLKALRAYRRATSCRIRLFPSLKNAKFLLLIPLKFISSKLSTTFLYPVNLRASIRTLKVIITRLTIIILSFKPIDCAKVFPKWS